MSRTGRAASHFQTFRGNQNCALLEPTPAFRQSHIPNCDRGKRIAVRCRWVPAIAQRRDGGRYCGTPRSEEHTSELQSLMRISYAVFCLKKKKQQTLRTTANTCKDKSTVSNNNNYTR